MFNFLRKNVCSQIFTACLRTIKVVLRFVHPTCLRVDVNNAMHVNINFRTDLTIVSLGKAVPRT